MAGTGSRTALAERYGPAGANLAIAWNDTLAGLLAHRSVRAYRPDPPPAGTLDT